jgi:hypothetical protein
MNRAITAFLASCLLNAGLAGCTVYKSSDRDDFNSNGKARAPAQAKPTTLSLDDQDLLANPCAAFGLFEPQDFNLLFGHSRLSMTNEISTKTSTCLIEAAGANQNSADFSDHFSSGLSTVSVLSCSWKPAGGQPVPSAATDFIPLQTTEDDLRQEGFSVIASTVASGSSLRMNCEAYVPTQSLRFNENDEAQTRLLVHSQQSADAAGDAAIAILTAKFNRFTGQLKRETLSASGQR